MLRRGELTGFKEPEVGATPGPYRAAGNADQQYGGRDHDECGHENGEPAAGQLAGPELQIVQLIEDPVDQAVDR
ncbi:Uncharacterised protein [Mycobacteroides abscessus subsp. abscessus]|nr:Uncharacterised protein [Mycobacteroides abscessus subsp. abscessus]SHP83430.1 Uncharacterised protein [Mycobacteroides abscessus subsp. abscessus]SHQ01058.1 Uncharacterised protein [Mycobacteroides abscessus subsp. abscessus]SHQ20385.1 Uncharacterised protein [Mycobacteroides abscessus subsp. abscessus]SHQ59322.1 Uncharacterised protein [Mycobacteroides abscessus subsp. abscessus]